MQRNGTPGLEWMMWTTLLKTTQWMIFAYHRKWMGPMVGPLLKMILDNHCCEGQPMENWHDGVQAGNKMQMLGMILVTGEKLKVIPLFE